MRCSYTESRFSQKVVSTKTLLCDRSILNFLFFALTLVFGGEVLHGDVALSVSMLLNEKQNRSFFKKCFCFSENSFQREIKETFKDLQGVSHKICKSFKPREGYFDNP